METVDVELMSQRNHLYERAASSFVGDNSPYAAFSWQSSAGTPDRTLNNSPCSSNTTLVDNETHGLEYDQLSQASVQETVPGVHSCRILAAQSIKSELNPNATTFIPDRFVEYGYFPPPIHAPEAWLHILDIGMLASNPTLPPLLVRLGPWSIDTLRDLAQLFCWEILAKANIVDFGPEAALFARDVRDTLTTHHSEWHSSCFVSHLQKYALDHFKSLWCSLDNPDAISQRNKLETKHWNVALDFSCFIADMFSFGLIEIPIMHECLGILLHEMVGVQHVRAVQAMVKRAGPTLWQSADSHERRQEFTTQFVERTTLLPDNASLTGREESIRKVIKADNIISLISGWQARRSECPPPAVKSIWGLSGLNM
ncbi:hypothetical protein DFJ58DRAFT_723463 [Suillus subalutaceus]|uniref:uncharacterized protein n=1 Tax=Suillus subalutaceus TaxID=48586 RepID=UPI001B8824AD|nr:uncharacterized protein DFJ58DRAFT_723463 [Suillus subalutaceus]KAG1869061.1 hypothetical protein DFJ58DRAFT_723463 [Suillus subalutaceus]